MLRLACVAPPGRTAVVCAVAAVVCAALVVVGWVAWVVVEAVVTVTGETSVVVVAAVLAVVAWVVEVAPVVEVWVLAWAGSIAKANTEIASSDASGEKGFTVVERTILRVKSLDRLHPHFLDTWIVTDQIC